MTSTDSVAVIVAALMSYRCQFTCDDDDDHLPLADKLSPLMDEDIARGKLEIELLADHLAEALATSAPAAEGDAFNALADDDAERKQYERDRENPENCLATSPHAGQAEQLPYTGTVAELPLLWRKRAERKQSMGLRAEAELDLAHAAEIEVALASHPARSPVQAGEVVAWANPDDYAGFVDGEDNTFRAYRHGVAGKDVPIYTTPQPAQPSEQGAVDDDALVPGDADDMAAALATIASTLGCDNTLDDILYSIDGLHALRASLNEVPAGYRYRRGDSPWRFQASEPPPATVGPRKEIEALYALSAPPLAGQREDNDHGKGGDNERQPQGTTSGGSPDYSPLSHPVVRFPSSTDYGVVTLPGGEQWAVATPVAKYIEQALTRPASEGAIDFDAWIAHAYPMYDNNIVVDRMRAAWTAALTSQQAGGK